MKKSIVILCMLLFGASIFAQHTTAPYVLHVKLLKETKEKVLKKDKEVMPAYEALLKDAGKSLKAGPFMVTAKPDPSPSTDKHDYVTIAPYWFPNPDTPDGLPYIRKDGVRTPELAKYPDKEALTKMVKAVENLSLAYYFSDDAKYAGKAITLLRTFFLDEATRMNPNLDYAQAIKGRNTGRGAGLIESRFFIKVIDAIGLLQTSGEWTAADQKGMEQWFAAFLKWMHESKNGKDEMRASNNHGVFYDAQRMSFALFTANQEVVDEVIWSFKRRIDVQQDTDGSFPAELTRTIGLHYSTFIMSAFFSIASMADHAGVDLWNYTSENGKSMKTALAFLYPYATGLSSWKWQQIKPYNYASECVDLFKTATLKYNDPKYAEGLHRVLKPEVLKLLRSNLVLGLEID